MTTLGAPRGFKIVMLVRYIFALLLPAALWGQSSSVVSVMDLGAHNDGSDPGDTTAAFNQAFAANPSGEIVIPAGTYALDNSQGPIQVNRFSGVVTVAGSATLVFQDPTQGGLYFNGGTGARIYGLTATYQTPPATRSESAMALQFSQTTDTSLNEVNITSSPGAGILFYESVRPKVRNAVIQNTLADGLHFANCQNPQAINISTNNTGDDGLAFVNYAASANYTGGSASNVTITNSASRGISVVGQSNVIVSNFTVNTTASSGILCAYDASYQTRIPANVSFSAGLIQNAGGAPNPVGNNYGIEYNGVGSCSFSNIQVMQSAGRGVAGMAPNGSISVTGVQVQQNSSGEAFSFNQTAQVSLSASEADNAAAYGFYFANCGNVTVNGITASNVSLLSGLHRAIWFESNQSVVASGLTVIDSQSSPTGYVVGTYDGGVSQSGLVNGVTAVLANGTLRIQNNSSNVQFRNVSSN